jgi:NAD(P)-dependent dehydrogenase (short-subunit alcohol dehydrogenase family)
MGFVVLAGVRTEADAKGIEQSAGQNVRAILIDVTDADSIARAARQAREICGDARLIGLVNNAGISVHGPVEHVPLSGWRRQMEVNLFGQIAVTQGAARIVMMSSIAGLIAQPIIAPYNASKFALEAVSDALRLELQPQGIKVCVVEPGAIDTPIWAKAEANPGAFPPDHPARVLYAREIDAIVNGARKAAANAIGADAVAKVVAKCLMLRRPRTRYRVGRDAMIGAMAKAVLPTWLLDRGMRWGLGI